MNFPLRRPCLAVLTLSFLLILLPSKAFVFTWDQDDWSGSGGQEYLKDPTMYYMGLGVDPWDEPGQLKLSRWSDCGPMDVEGVYSFCEVNGTLYAGTGNSGIVYMSTDDGATWTPISASLADAQRVHDMTVRNDTIYAAATCYYGGSYHARVFRIWDGGLMADTTGAMAGGESFAVLVDGSDVYAGTGGTGHYAGQVYRSTDGFDWNPTDQLETEQIRDLLLAADGSIWAAGKTVTQGGIWRSADAGASWDLVTYLGSSVFALVQDDAGAIYAGTSTRGYIFRTADNGATWDTTTLEHAVQPGTYAVYSLMKTNDGALFAGTAAGYVYRSYDGDTWTKTGFLSGAPVWGLYHTSDSLTYAGNTASPPAFKFGSFRESGWIESSKFDTRCNLDYGWINWVGTTGLTLKVRTNSHFAMDWEDCDPVDKWEDISAMSSVEDGDRYLQYWVGLETADPQTSPSLDLIQLDFTTVTDQARPVVDAVVIVDTASPGPFEISAIITDEPCSVEPESVWLHWSTDGWATQNATHMVQMGDTFSAQVARLTEGDSLWYYVQANDLAWDPNYRSDPRRGADSSFAFWIVPEPPRIAFYPFDVCIRDTAFAGPWRVNCRIVDFGDGIDDSTVTVNWRFGWGEWQSAIMTPGAHDGYFGVLPRVPDAEVNIKIDYYIEACDVYNPSQCRQRPQEGPCTFYYVAGGDVGPLGILDIPEEVNHGFTYTPSAVVANRGRELVPAFDVSCRITDEFGKYTWTRDVRTVSSLAGGEVAFVEFGEWIAPLDVSGALMVTVWTDFPNDSVPGNDEISSGVTVSIEEEAIFVQLPDAYAISQNRPNPFSRSSVISYEIPDTEGQQVQTLIRVYDAVGKVVKVLVDEVKRPGYHTTIWDGTSGSGNLVPSGIYFYKISAGDFTVTKKMILVR